MRDTVGEVRMNSYLTFSKGPLHTEEQVLDDQLEFIYYSSIQTQNVVCKTYREQWTIKTNGKRELEKSVQEARHDEDDDDAPMDGKRREHSDSETLRRVL